MPWFLYEDMQTGKNLSNPTAAGMEKVFKLWKGFYFREFVLSGEVNRYNGGLR